MKDRNRNNKFPKPFSNDNSSYLKEFQANLALLKGED